MALTTQRQLAATKGLRTEDNLLLLEDGYSSDELNMEVSPDKIRQRRKSVQFESSSQNSTYNHTQGIPTYSDTWENPGELSDTVFLVVQHGALLFFYDQSSTSVSTTEKTFSVDLTSFSAGNGVDIATNGFQGTYLKGIYAVVHPALNPFYISYDPATDTISTATISIEERDFDWQGSVSDYRTESSNTSPGAARIYDTFNAGWLPTASIDPLGSYTSSRGKYPALTHSWFSGKTGTSTFSVTEYLDIYTGTSLTSNGHYIFNTFFKDREAIVAGAGVEIVQDRFNTIATFAGRFWYSGLSSGRVYFSRTIKNEEDYGACFQVNDPTSEEISDLLDSDGGVIDITAASNIKRLFPLGSSLMVFAENGIWIIQGVDNVFKATEYSVSPISNQGIASPYSLVNVKGVPIWWSLTDINTMQENGVTSLSAQSIKTFYNNISNIAKSDVRGVFDFSEDKVYWLYAKNSEPTLGKYNNILVLDLNEGGFFPWEVSDQTSNTDYITDIFLLPPYISSTVEAPVTSNSITVTSNGVTVTVSERSLSTSSSAFVKFLARDTSTGKQTVADLDNNSFYDWGDASFQSFLEVGQTLLDSWTLDKYPLYMTTFFLITESGFELNSDGTGYDLLTPSDATLKAYWDFRKSPSTTAKVYRFKRPVLVDTSSLSTFDYPETVLRNRTRIRGNGKIAKFRFESAEGKDMKMLGYEFFAYSNEGF